MLTSSSQLLWEILLLPGGFLAGLVNVLAGGGSFLTLPLLMATGLPLEMANATNRLSVLLQGGLATFEYRRKGQLDTGLYKKLLPPILAGALIGAYLATKLDPAHLRQVFGAIFLLMAGLLLIRARIKRPESKPPHALRYPALFLIGIYGGFIQAGVGLWILIGASSLFSVSVLRTNSVKLPLTLTFTVPALLIFLQADMVRWFPGMLLAIGTVLGTLVGVRMTLKGGEKVILRAVLVVLILTGTHLLFSPP